LRATAPGLVELVDVAPADPGPGHVRVAVRRCGICGSDLHWFTARQPLPSVCPGHEISGVVEALGRDVTGWSAGDRVCIEPIVRCGQCERCRRGDYHLCPRLGFNGVTLPGGMATTLVVPSYALFRLPPTVDFELGALAEPTAVTVHALRLAPVEGANVLVLGAGTIGQLAAVAARHLGAASVAITARHAHQRDTARELGCDQVFDPDRIDDIERRPQLVIETVGGSATTLADGVNVVSRGGSVVVVGLFDRPPAFDPLALVLKEVRIIGSLVYNRGGKEADFETALAILAQHGEALRRLVTHVFALDNAQRAFETAADKSSGAVKVMLEPSDRS
jgi:(R,R)-butanediol dehydrogenase / meso-butanediol dehydrogenase / diacetyl reductase